MRHTIPMKVLNYIPVLLILSRNQKLNVRWLAESELVGAYDSLKLFLWSKYFIEAQLYSVERNKMYQDNQPTMLLEINGGITGQE